MPWVFGNTITYRDADELPGQQLTVAYFSEFMRSGQPNPPQALLAARAYTTAAQLVKKSGPWNAVSGDRGPIKKMVSVEGW